jgi:hypothetical protein
VIYWDGARVLGMLAMSRAIGQSNFLFVVDLLDWNTIWDQFGVKI